MFQKTKKPCLELAKEVLGSDLFLRLKEIEPDVMLYYTISGFF